MFTKNSDIQKIRSIFLDRQTDIEPLWFIGKLHFKKSEDNVSLGERVVYGREVGEIGESTSERMDLNLLSMVDMQ